MAARTWIALALVGGCAALAIVRSRPPAPRGLDAPATEFSAARALEVLRRVLGDESPHPVGTRAHAEVRERILAELHGLGLEPEVLESVAGTQTSIALVRNIVARIPGSEKAKAILLCAHYDSVPAGPGAGDDGSGVAALLEAVRALRSGAPLRRPVILLLTDAEECGLVGAEAYAGFAGEKVRDEVEVVLNVDARGTEGPTFLFETSEGNADLVRIYGRSVDRPRATSAAYEVYKRMPNDTDLTVFKRGGVAGLNFAFIGGLRRYHTPRDDLEHLSPASVQDEGDQLLAVARALATEEFTARAAENLVYTDVLGFFLVRWPVSRSLPAALAILLALVLVVVRDVRRGATRAAALGRGLLRGIATVAGAAVAAFAIVRGIELLRAEPEPWAGHPLPFRIAIVAGAMLAALLVTRSSWLARSGFEASWSAVWLVLAALGVASSAWVPGLCYLFLLPCAIAVLTRFTGSEAIATLVPACALALSWIPLAIGLEQAVELRAPLALGLPIGCILAVAGPNWPRATRTSLVLFAIVLGISSAWALVAPASTTDRPAWLTLTHLEEAGTDGARLFAVAYGSSLPEELRETASFSERPERAFPELGWLPSGYVASVESVPADAARIEVLATRTERDARFFDVRISSPRGAPCLVIHTRGLLRDKTGCGVVSLTLGGRPVHGMLWGCQGQGSGPWESDRILFGVPEEGVELTLRAPLSEPAELLVLDVAYGLPPTDAEIARARPDRFVPRGQGDQWVVARRLEL